LADVKISALPASTTPLAGTEVLPIVQSSTTRQVSVANLTAGRAVSALSIATTTGASFATTSGSVGIGISSPVAKLHVVGGETRGVGAGFFYSGYRANGTTRQFYLGGSDTEFYINVDQAVPMILTTSGTERMRITSTGDVGIGISSPNASAILDVQSTTKGVRMPNMTTTQKNAISTPAAGLMVFDTTLAKLCVYSGSAWQTITSI
jgi:hypothetical protein